MSWSEYMKKEGWKEYFTPPFGDLLDHLRDCCGGCPYCVQLCQQVVDEATVRPKAISMGQVTASALIDTGVGLVTVSGRQESVDCHLNFIKAHRDHWPCATLSRVQESSTSGYNDRIGNGGLWDTIRWIFSRISR